MVGLPGERAAFLPSAIQVALSSGYDALVLDWYGNLSKLNLPTVDSALPYTAIRPHLHRALSVQPGLGASPAVLEAVIAECVSEAPTLQQALSSLLTRSNANPAVKLAYLQIAE